MNIGDRVRITGGEFAGTVGEIISVGVAFVQVEIDHGGAVSVHVGLVEPVFAEDTVVDHYHAAKFDQGKHPAALIPWETYERLGTGVNLVAALCLWQHGRDGEREVLGDYLLILDHLEILEVAMVLEHGAKKYAANSWRSVPNGIERYRNALWRHELARLRGEDTDPDSGLPHSAHRDCNAMFLYALLRAGEEQ